MPEVPPAPRHPGFAALFGRPPEVAASAPGRVNLIGEHTDYNGGFVLPTAIPQRTTVELARRADRVVRVWSDLAADSGIVTYTLGEERRASHWADYVRGVTWALGAEGFSCGGADLRISSSVPLGSGLSSSAALEMSVVKALRVAFDLPLEPLVMARVGRRAENEFVGAPTGVMDQMASVLADDGHALFLDTRSLAYRVIGLPAAVDLLVINSGIRHNLLNGDYAMRRRECEAACRVLGIGELRDLGPEDLGCLAALPDTLRRRARHVVTENARVLAAVEAIEAGDAAALGRLFLESHVSMRDDYEVSVPEIDLLVELALQDRAVRGARLTGGGFGGSIVALVERGEAARVGARVAAWYGARTGLAGTVLVPSA